MNRNSWDTKPIICSKYFPPPTQTLLSCAQAYLFGSVFGSVLYRDYKKLPFLMWCVDCAKSVVITARESGDPNSPPWCCQRDLLQVMGKRRCEPILQRARELLLLESHFWRLTSWSLLVPSDVKRLLWKLLPIHLPCRANKMSKGVGGMKEHTEAGTNLPVCYVVQVKCSWKRGVPSSLKQGNNPWPKGDLKAESLLFIERQWRQLNFHYFMSFIILQTFSWDLQTSQRRELVSCHLRDKSVVASLLFLWQLSSDFWSSRLVSISYLFRAFLFSKFLCSHPLRDKQRQKRPVP